MKGGVLNTRGLFVVAATIAALLFAIGCGSSSDAEVAVQTGSLSKAEFIEKADAICQTTRDEFLTKYTAFFKAHKSDFGNKQKEKALLGEMVETLLTAHVEGKIDQISKLGAPDDFAPEATAFLDALQTRLGEVRENPVELTATSDPFIKAEEAARKAGMDGCAESLP